MSKCYLCPRMCGADRSAGERGVCSQGADIRVSRAALHQFEEPPISGSRGAGTVFFSGCSLRCVFCQNREISRGCDVGDEVSPRALADIFLRLEAEGAHNIDLVTPTHFADGVIAALEIARPRLSIPIVYNTSGYERVETLRRFEGLIDVYLPDFKYASGELAAKYSSARDYPEVASAALTEMHRQVGKYSYGEDGLLRRGLVVRHLVLPSHRQDSMAVLLRLSELLPVGDILLSLMSQYTPEFAFDSEYKELRRRVTSFEYGSVLEYAHSLGFEGFMQGRSSASAKYTPDF
ncbi:MAG: radical SAM protein [Clostridia bacterium]|nr:radical SAM protein [Clostridia bacterium]